MRTTVDIDPDLLQSLRDLAHRSGRSFREELNRAITRGLRAEPIERPADYIAPTFPMGVRPGVDLDRALDIAARLEYDETARELQAFR